MASMQKSVRGRDEKARAQELTSDRVRSSGSSSSRKLCCSSSPSHCSCSSDLHILQSNRPNVLSCLNQTPAFNLTSMQFFLTLAWFEHGSVMGSKKRETSSSQRVNMSVSGESSGNVILYWWSFVLVFNCRAIFDAQSSKLWIYQF